MEVTMVDTVTIVEDMDISSQKNSELFP